MKKCGAVFVAAVLVLLACGNAKKAPGPGAVKPIASETEFNGAVEGAGSRLLVFDLYADWCGPCRMLSPMLERLAEDNIGRVTFYKVNIDKVPGVARSFGVSGIPFVVFMKNGKAVETLMGLQPQEAYVQIINQYAQQ